MNKITVGIDPGLPLTMGVLVDGKPSFFCENDEVATQVQKPRRKGLSWKNNPILLAHQLKRLVRANVGADLHVIIEQVSMRPEQDMGSGQDFVGSMHMAMGVCAGLDIPFSVVVPSVWKPHMGIKVTMKNPKEPARQAALQQWPEHAGMFARKMDHNRAEAFLLARYYDLTGR